MRCVCTLDAATIGVHKPKLRMACPPQVEGIQRLANLLQQLAANRTGTTATVRAGSIEQLGAFLQWLVAEAATLSPDARTEAFWWVLLLLSDVPGACCHFSCFPMPLMLMYDKGASSVDERHGKKHVDMTYRELITGSRSSWAARSRAASRHEPSALCWTASRQRRSATARQGAARPRVPPRRGRPSSAPRSATPPPLPPPQQRQHRRRHQHRKLVLPRP